MISREDFAKLRKGDVLMVNDSPRIVHIGPADMVDGYFKIMQRNGQLRKNPAMYVTFLKKNRGKFHKATTCYLYTDIYKIAELPRRRIKGFALRCLLRIEIQTQLDRGIDVVKERRDWIKNQIRLEGVGLHRMKCFQRKLAVHS